MNGAVVDTTTAPPEGAVKAKKSKFTYNPNRVAHTLNKLGLGYFSPFARLIGKDEPAKQLREIALNTLLPIVAFAGFVIAWAVLAKAVQTDSVQIPSPHQAWYALTGTAIPAFSHPFPESIEGLEAPYFADNDGMDPKSINGFAQAEKLAEKEYMISQQERVDKFLARSEEAAAEGDTEKAAKYKENSEMFASKTYQGNKTFYDQIWISLLTVAIGFIVATVVAVPIGVLCGISPMFNIAMNPLIQLFKPVSPLAWFPIVFVFTTWGIATPPSDSIWQRALFTSAGVVMLCSLWPTLINTAVGVASVDKDHLNVAKVLKLGWAKRIGKIVLPASLPLIFTGLRLSIGVGWMVLIAADMMAQNQGLGKFVWDMYQNGDTMSTAQIIVAVFVIGAIGFFLDRIMLVCQRLVTFEEQNI
ncbi:MAG: nitrate ABC transporter permease [Verrucomicrobiales bacterium]|nr:nitrate ABC transporter permease [Verrucomicrobiales bacterium]